MDTKMALPEEELEKIAGGGEYDAQWEAWAKAWKAWWIDHYGNVYCNFCRRQLKNVIKDYDIDQAYSTYMNNSFKCKCGNVLRATESWK